MCMLTLTLDEFKRIADRIKVSYIRKVPGHKGSDGKLREWCIFSHKTNKLLQSYFTKEEAKKALQRMHTFS